MGATAKPNQLTRIDVVADTQIVQPVISNVHLGRFNAKFFIVCSEMFNVCIWLNIVGSQLHLKGSTASCHLCCCTHSRLMCSESLDIFGHSIQCGQRSTLRILQKAVLKDAWRLRPHFITQVYIWCIILRSKCHSWSSWLRPSKRIRLGINEV